MNQAIIMGNLARDVELKYLPDGKPIGTTAIAQTSKWKDKTTGEPKEDVLFIDVAFYGKTAETANEYLKKGSKLQVVGSIKLEQWKDKETGASRSKHIIKVKTMQMLGCKENGDIANAPDAPHQKDTEKKDK